jgi:hypothetical protein
LVTCPNCGQPVREGQKFCGACGAEIPAPAGASSVPPSPDQEQAAPYAYEPPPAYGYEAQQPPAPFGGRMVLAGGVLLLALCCALACGILLGILVAPDVLEFFGFRTVPVPRITPARVPTPTGLNLLPFMPPWLS